MVLTKRIPSVEALQRLHRLAWSVPEEVVVRSPDGTVSADAKSPMGLFTLDYSEPVEIETDSPAVLEEVERWP